MKFGDMSNMEFLLPLRVQSEQEAADAIVQGGVFDDAVVVSQNDTSDPDFGDADFVIFYQVKSLRANNAGPWLAQWQVKRRGNDVVRPANVDMGTHEGTARYTSFDNSVRRRRCSSAARPGPARSRRSTNSAPRPPGPASSSTAMAMS